MSRRHSWVRLVGAFIAAAAILGICAPPTRAIEGPQGLTTPMVLPPYNATAPSCSAPPGLRKVLGFAQDNNREFMQGVSAGLARAASDRGLDYQIALADNDGAKMLAQLRAFHDARIGAVVVAPIDPTSVSLSLQQLIWDGSYVGAVVPPPATLILNAPQYLAGKALGDAATSYIETKLGGKATVVILTHDSLQFLAPRFVAIRDALKRVPDVTIAADVSPATVNEAGGFATMNLILAAHPDVDVVLGADTVVLGALAALRVAGKARPDQFLGGIDGEPDAVAIR